MKTEKQIKEAIENLKICIKEIIKRPDDINGLNALHHRFAFDYKYALEWVIDKKSNAKEFLDNCDKMSKRIKEDKLKGNL